MNAPEGGLYRPLVLSLALFLVAAGALLAIQMVSAIVGPFRLAEIGEHDPRTSVALWRPLHAAAGEAARSALSYELVESGRAVRETDTLDALDPARVGAIVLSEPRGLDAAQVAALESYLEAGGGVVLMGSVAVLDAQGAWRGREAMARLLGAEVVPLESGADTALVAARRGPLSGPLDPRQRIAVVSEPGTPGLRTSDAELRWSGAADAPAASIRREKGRGRLVWMAVPPERALPGEWERGLLRRVLEAGVAWASRTPSVEMLPWPSGAPFAGVVEGADGVSTASLESAWRSALTDAARDAGLAELRVPQDAAARNALQPLLGRTLAAAGRERAWIATRKDLSHWLLARAVVDARVRRAGPRRLVVEVTNRGERELAGVVLRVRVNEPVRSARAEGTEILQADAQVQTVPGEESIDLFLPRLEPRASDAWSLDVDAANAEENAG